MPVPATSDVGLTDITAKVRLGGPVRGRGAVCRDLEQDLRRIKALGVGCIVWYFSLSYLPLEPRVNRRTVVSTTKN